MFICIYPRSYSFQFPSLLLAFLCFHTVSFSFCLKNFLCLLATTTLSCVYMAMSLFCLHIWRIFSLGTKFQICPSPSTLKMLFHCLWLPIYYSANFILDYNGFFPRLPLRFFLAIWLWKYSLYSSFLKFRELLKLWLGRFHLFWKILAHFPSNIASTLFFSTCYFWTPIFYILGLFIELHKFLILFLMFLSSFSLQCFRLCFLFLRLPVPPRGYWHFYHNLAIKRQSSYHFLVNVRRSQQKQNVQIRSHNLVPKMSMF